MASALLFRPSRGRNQIKPESPSTEENMKTKCACFALLTLAAAALTFLPNPGYAASKLKGDDPSSLQLEVAPGEWRPVDLALSSEEPVKGSVLPFLFFDESGNIRLTRVPVEGEGFFDLFKEMAGDCNGGQCASGGVALNCPTSGGPTCSAGQTCKCKCDGGGGSTSTYNECSGGGGGELEM
jgi:hypothetical protein